MTREEARQYYNDNEGWLDCDDFSNEAENIIDIILYLNECGILDEMMPEVEGVKSTIGMFDILIFMFDNEMPRIKNVERFITYARGRIKEIYPMNAHLPNGAALTAFDVVREIRKIIRDDKDERL